MALTLTFCGAAGTVTGSCYWLNADGTEFLVDCGLFQGPKNLKELNYRSLPFDPARIAFVLLTHAHIDHAGLLPRLVREGFAGPIFASAGTQDLLSFLLPDSASIHEMEVTRLNRRNQQRGRPQVLPIFTDQDVQRTLAQIRPVEPETWIALPGAGRARFWDAGHILGSTSIEVEVAAMTRRTTPQRLLFSGDIGPDHKLFQKPPSGPASLDYLICESTYGNERRPVVTPSERRAMLGAEVNRALRRGGNLLIPTFAVERTQELLHDLTMLFDDGTVPEVPVFLDSPLAIKATEVFTRHLDGLDLPAARPNPFRRANIHPTPAPADSKAINRFRGGAIILAGSGMCEAGRIRFHLKENLWRSECSVLLVGFQATGTLGSLLAGGATTVRIQGEDIRVNAEVRRIGAYTGHADADGLLRWIGDRLPVRGAIFLTHGERDALLALQHALEMQEERPGQVLIPSLDDAFRLDRRARAIRPAGARRLNPRLVGKLDWHNDLAALSIRLRDTLEGQADDKARTRLLRELSRIISAADR